MLTILCKKKRYIKALRYGKLESLFQKNYNVEISKNKCFTDSLHRKTKLIQRLAYDCKNFENYRLRVLVQCGIFH